MTLSASPEDTNDQALLRVLNPGVARKYKPMPPANRVNDLSKSKIGLYWNYKKHGDVALNRVKDLLSEKFEGLSFEWLETGPVNEATEEWFENVRQREISAVIATTGD